MARHARLLGPHQERSDRRQHAVCVWRHHERCKRRTRRNQCPDRGRRRCAPPNTRDASICGTASRRHRSRLAVTPQDKRNFIDLTGLARLRWIVRISERDPYALTRS